MPARLDKAPFGFVSIGVSPYYRKASVQKWLDDNTGTNVKYTPAGTDHDIPIETTYLGDAKRATALRLLGSITPENVLAVRERLIAQNRELVYDFMTKRTKQFIVEEIGEYDPAERVITSNTRFAEPVWFTASVKAMRLAQNELSGLGFTEQEVLALPVGDVPPLKETK